MRMVLSFFFFFACFFFPLYRDRSFSRELCLSCTLYYNLVQPHLWRNGWRAPLECAVDRGFESRSGQTKDYKLGICCFSAKHAALRRKNKDWLARNQINVSDWSDMSTSRLLLQ